MKLALACEAQRIRTGEALVEVEALVFCNGAELYGQHVANGRNTAQRRPRVRPAIGHSAHQATIDVNGAAAHPLNDAGLFESRA